MNFNKINLSRSQVITPARLKVMRDHVRQLINEATQEPEQDLFHGAILISKLITICIENLKRQGFHYIQGDRTEIGYLYDELSKELTVIFMKQNDIKNGESDGKKQKGFPKGDKTIHTNNNESLIKQQKRLKRRKKAEIVVEQPLDESKRNAEFLYPFSQPNLEPFFSEPSSDEYNRFDDNLFDFPFGKDEKKTLEKSSKVDTGHDTIRNTVKIESCHPRAYENQHNQNEPKV
ncbi:6062_t:CDS:2 [Funneliformis geosporum]|uniref:5193_t:CDS:1 n=1 Tax=Funneliformis geosporum TaxID=1117311 RepID=A0A9W4WYX6_9GLOM|nr:6062_t:CDS:2 [Funneliformis geosporum]CAI2173935.1 5193_t:CDS:2 [Funneliformis geosporum]